MKCTLSRKLCEEIFIEIKKDKVIYEDMQSNVLW
jgi:hypothetical protein